MVKSYECKILTEHIQQFLQKYMVVILLRERVTSMSHVIT